MGLDEQIYAIIARHLEVDISVLSREVRIRSLPNASSIQILQIILDIEESLGIDIDEDTTFRLETLGEFQDEIARIYPPKDTRQEYV
ncbi:Uncharacterised protein [Mycobacteroides abscessus subsp. massiliense]|nr:Uncharacterised protein [Mycobacteroides abscessus subsp. massiliense]